MNVVAQQPTNGYQSTEIGVIPVDWKVSKLGRIGKFKNGINKDADSFGYGLPFINLMDVFGKPHISGNEKLGLINSTEIERKEYDIKESDVLFIRSSVKPSGVGLTSVALQNLKDAVYSGFLIRYRSNDDLTTDFKRHCFYDSGFRNRLIAASTVSANTNINQDALKELQVAYPSNTVEQTAIANALSDVDALLTELEKLIAKKQAIKTATMQQLLTGKTRLPQFATYTEGEKQGQPKGTKPSELGKIPEDWDVVSIAKLTKNIIDYRGRTPKKLGMDWGGGDIVALSAGNVKKGYIDFEEECYLGSDELYKKWMKNGDVEQNDIVFTMEAPLGNVALVPDSKRYILSQRTILLQLKREEYESTFVYQLMMSDQFQKLLSDSATGSTAQGIKRTRFEQLLLCLPSSKEEQTAIATILSDMDNETQTLEQRLAKTRQVKQGMMQELLTGRTRLPF